MKKQVDSARFLELLNEALPEDPRYSPDMGQFTKFNAGSGYTWPAKRPAQDIFIDVAQRVHAKYEQV